MSENPDRVAELLDANNRYLQRARIAEASLAKLVGKKAPVQGFTGGIPWDMHLRAYDVYCKRYSAQKALIEGGCRGGFGTGELDMFIPGWREELSERRLLIEALQMIAGYRPCPDNLMGNVDIAISALSRAGFAQ